MATQIATTEPRTQSSEAEHFTLMQRQAVLFANSPLIPESLRKGGGQQAIANCYIAMTIADRMGEDRMTVMQNIIVVHGTAGFKSQYMIARANSSGVFKDGIDWEISGKGQEMSATAFAILAATDRRVQITVDMAMAKAEGWTKNTKYQTMPEIMLRYRSAAFLVRMYAPQVMLGHQTAEEVEDVRYATVQGGAPLTGQMLLEQASEEVVDAETGEVTDQPSTATDAPPDQAVAAVSPTDAEQDEAASLQPGRDDSEMDDGFADDAPHPAEAAANRLMQRIKASTELDLFNTLVNDARTHIAAMPPEMAETVNGLIERKRKQLGAG